MGAGYHGGFGNTQGNQERYRIGHPVPPTQKTFEMALNSDLYIKAVCDKYNIHLKSGSKEIIIVFNRYLKGGSAPEETAYASGNTLEDYIRGKK